MKRITLHLGILFMIFQIQSCKKENIAHSIDFKQNYSSQEIDNYIISEIANRETTFDWEWANDNMLWSAIEQSGYQTCIGYKPENASKDDAHKFNVDNNVEWKNAKQKVVDLILETEKEVVPYDSLKTLKVSDMFDKLNFFSIKIRNKKTLINLRHSNLIRYIDAPNYQLAISKQNNRSGLGCSGGGSSYLTQSDYTTYLNTSGKLSWDYYQKNILSAWSKSMGQGIKVLVIDAGLSNSQQAVKYPKFSNPYGYTGRTMEAVGLVPTGTDFWGTYATGFDTNPYSSCNHGTAMVGLIGAPFNNSNSSIGIAPSCNIKSYRASDDVLLLDHRENLGVAYAFLVSAYFYPDEKIISMSMGSIFTVNSIKDAVIAAKNAGKLIFCAAGTSSPVNNVPLLGTVPLTGWGVIFPANMNEVQACTGIKSDGTIAENCHSGSQVDYVSIVERTPNKINPLTLSSLNDNNPATVGGSSAATAQTAAIAALVWARNPSASANLVLGCMTAASSNSGTNKSSSFGWGTINANLAVTYMQP